MYKKLLVGTLILAPLAVDLASRHTAPPPAGPVEAGNAATVATAPVAPQPMATPSAMVQNGSAPMDLAGTQPQGDLTAGTDPTPALDPTPMGAAPMPEAPRAPPQPVMQQSFAQNAPMAAPVPAPTAVPPGSIQIGSLPAPTTY